jgi:RNA polymerase sigma factor (sigma-70 family)
VDLTAGRFLRASPAPTSDTLPVGALRSLASVDTVARHRWIGLYILPHEREVRAWLRRYVHSLTVADADDLIQEAYARLWLGDFGHIVNARSYFYAIVRNLLFERARHARIVPMERLGEIEALRIPSEEPSPERVLGARQELERLLQLVEELPERCQRAFCLQKFEGLSQREIAQEMNISEKTVEKHLSRALMGVLDGLKRFSLETKDSSREPQGHDTRSVSD